jgi:PHS family inorganic phosphate transporter-like MFS transporter
MVLPIISIVYWNGNIPPNVELAINMATLVGVMIGQVVVGIMADRYGRKKMFGALLLIMIAGTVPLALLSRGTANNINFLSWMISWRLLTGIGIGGDFPLRYVDSNLRNKEY